MKVIDLRSDFLTRPSPAMRAAAEAARDSYCFGLREDPWQQQLEARVAALVGKEDALVFPTCTMANTVALMLLATPGSRVLTQPAAHVLMSEAGAGAALGGLVLSAVGSSVLEPSEMAMPALSDWALELGASSDVQRPPVGLCVLENTHNRAGGVPLALAYIDAVAALARASGVGLHLDGARLFHAALAQRVELAAIAAPFETVALSLNKAVGAPIAAILAGTGALIERALVVRQRLGGGLRPTGPACAAALAGLDELEELAVIPALASRLADGLADCPNLKVNSQGVLTNLVVVEPRPPDTPIASVARMAALGLRALAFDHRRIRFALYRGIDAAQIDRAIDVVRRVMAKR